MEEVLAQPTRRRIFEVVSAHPGASARDVQRLAGLAWGETAYHLDQLTKAGALRRERGGRRDYYFVPQLSWDDRRFLQALRHPAQRNVLLRLTETPDQSLSELSEGLGVSLSTISFHVRQLLARTVIEAHRDGNILRYRVIDPVRVAQLLKGYRASFQDRLVDRFVDAFSGLLGG